MPHLVKLKDFNAFYVFRHLAEDKITQFFPHNPNPVQHRDVADFEQAANTAEADAFFVQPQGLQLLFRLNPAPVAAGEVITAAFAFIPLLAVRKPALVVLGASTFPAMHLDLLWLPFRFGLSLLL
jgi:hypothetical protein